MKLAVCVPFRDSVTRTKFAISLGKMVYPCEWELFTTEKAYYDEARNVMVRDGLKWGADFFLHLDDDMLPPPDLASQLIARDVDIIAALYFQRRYPYLSTILRYDAEGYLCTLNGGIAHTGVLSLDAVGLGCMLVKADVYKRLEAPWYLYNDWRLELKRSNPMEMITEDVAFCVRAKQAGFGVYCDTNIVVPHCSDELIVAEKEHLLAYAKWTKEIKK